MYMRIGWGKLRPGQWAKYAAAYEQTIPVSEGMPGFIGRWLGKDADDPDSGYTVSLWETKEDLDRWDELSRNTLLPAMEPYFTGEFRISRCEVAISTTPQK